VKIPAVSDALPPVPPMSEGAIAAFGSLEIALIASPPSFEVDGKSCTKYRVRAPGVTIGREAPADVRMHGSPERFQEVSASHLMLMLSPVGWVIRDDDSTNGTYAMAPGGRRARLNPNQQMAVIDGMLIELPQQIAFTIRKLGDTAGGTVLSKDTPLGPTPGVWPDDPDLRALLEVLIEPFRPGGSTPRFNAEYVCDRLGWTTWFAQERRRRLAREPRLRNEVPDPDGVKFAELALAASRAYPELVNLPGTGERVDPPTAGEPPAEPSPAESQEG
jgi:pSer/pThr/pTyr-binding forkhead associated (FHA) protein